MSDDLGADSWMRLVEAARAVMNDAGERTVDRAAWLGVVVRLRAATARLKTIVPSAVPLGFGVYTDVELLQWWRKDPITPIRTVLAGSGTFAGRPGFFESIGGGLADGFAWLWRLVIGLVIFVGVVVIGGLIVWVVRR